MTDGSMSGRVELRWMLQYLFDWPEGYAVPARDAWNVRSKWGTIQWELYVKTWYIEFRTA